MVVVIMAARAGFGQRTEPQAASFDIIDGSLGTPVSSSSGGSPCSTHQDFRFTSVGSAAKLSSIQFQNFYVGAIGVSQELRDAPGQWQRLIVRKKLMVNPHFENDAQDWRRITLHELGPHFCGTKVSRLRFHLYQPSPVWMKFELRHLRCFAPHVSGGAGGRSGLSTHGVLRPVLQPSSMAATTTNIAGGAGAGPGQPHGNIGGPTGTSSALTSPAAGIGTVAVTLHASLTRSQQQSTPVGCAGVRAASAEGGGASLHVLRAVLASPVALGK